MSKRRVSVTNRTRIILALAPILAPVLFVLTTLIALDRAVREFGREWLTGVKDDWRWWYRDIYRPARFGSVFDDE